MNVTTSSLISHSSPLTSYLHLRPWIQSTMTKGGKAISLTSFYKIFTGIFDGFVLYYLPLMILKRMDIMARTSKM